MFFELYAVAYFVYLYDIEYGDAVYVVAYIDILYVVTYDQPMLARTNKQVGEAIRRTRRQAGLTQQDLADKMSVRQATISSLENGHAGTSLQIAMSAMAALGLELTINPKTQSRDVEDLF